MGIEISTQICYVLPRFVISCFFCWVTVIKFDRGYFVKARELIVPLTDHHYLLRQMKHYGSEYQEVDT
jgi:hypothetical protein